MQKYFYFWIFFIIVSAIWHGYEGYKENRDAGYNKVYFEKTGKKVYFHGGFRETILGTIGGSLGLIISPVFLAIETLKFIPAAIILYFISKYQ